MKLGDLCVYVDGIATSGGDLGYLEIGDVNVETKSYDVVQKEKLSVRGAVKVPAGTLPHFNRSPNERSNCNH